MRLLPTFRRLFRPGIALLALSLLAPATALAEITIVVTGVDGDLKRNVLALLSVERYKDRDRIEPDAMERLYRRVDDETRDALKPFGYYDPVIHSDLQRVDRGRNWRVSIAIEPGQPVKVESVDVEVSGPGRDDEVFKRILADPPIKVGDTLLHTEYEKYKSALQGAAIVYGYLDAKMLRNQLLVDTDKHTASVQLAIETGVRYRFGATTIHQTAVRESLLRRYLRYREGEPFDANKLQLTSNALDNAQYFSNLSAEVGTVDREQHIVPIVITGERTRRYYRIGPGYGTDTGPRLTANLLVPRLNDRGHRLQLQLQTSNILQSFSARHDIPIGDPARDRFTNLFEAKQQWFSTGVRTSDISFTPSVSRVLGRWQRVISLAFAHKETRDPQNVRTVDALIVPSLVYASVPSDFLGQDLFSRTFYAEVLGSHKALGANANFLRFDFQGERRFDLARRGETARWHLLLRGELGLSRVSFLQELPGDYRFFAGGDRSVRGFARDSLSPLQRDNPADPTLPLKPVGGRHLITGSVEFERDLPRNFGIAAFVDAGNAVNKIGDPVAVSFGLGMRYRLPGVTLGLDIGQAVHYPLRDPLTGQPLAMPGPRLHLNIALRQ